MGHQRQMQLVEVGLSKNRVKPVTTWARTIDEIDTAFQKMSRDGVQALFVLLGPFLVSQRTRIAELALKHKVPTFTNSSEFADAGSLLAYGTSVSALFHRAATYVDKILKGAKAGELPVEQPTKFETVINLRTAKALGLTMPGALLVTADRLIQ